MQHVLDSWTTDGRWDGAGSAASLLRRATERARLRHADWVVVPSAAAAVVGNHDLGAPASRFVVFYPGVDLQQFAYPVVSSTPVAAPSRRWSAPPRWMFSCARGLT